MVVKGRVWRLLLVTAIFVMAGPPIGGIVAWTSLGAFNLRSPVPFITGSYREGVLLALGSGLLVAFSGLWLAMRSWRVPVISAVTINIVFFVLTANMDLSRADYLTAFLSMMRVFLPPSLVAALACWFLTRRLLRENAQDAANSGA